MHKGRAVTPVALPDPGTSPTFDQILDASGYTRERLEAMRRYVDDPTRLAAMILNGARMPSRVKLPNGHILIKDSVPELVHAAYRTQQGMRVMVSDDDGPHGRLRHVSVSYARRLPTWAEMAAVRESFFDPLVDVMMMFPRKGRYVNLAEYCLHMWQTPEQWEGDLMV